jgi:immune inhibitor A
MTCYRTFIGAAIAAAGILALLVVTLGPLAASPMVAPVRAVVPVRGGAAVDPAEEGVAGPAMAGPVAPPDGIVSLAEPDEILLDALARARSGDGASPAALGAGAEAVLADWRRTNFHGPAPDDQARVLRNEQMALAAGGSPRSVGLAVSGTLRLLVIAVEFAGSDRAENISHPRSMTERTCVTETLTFTGPLHGQIPPPGPRDNNTLWLPDFGARHFENLIFGTAGITERVRMDLTDPEDGRPGIDMSGQTMQAYLDEASGGLVRLEPGPAGTVAWLQVPHSEAYYGASRCSGGQAPDVAAMNGLPGNRSGASQLVRDAADIINQRYPDFPWTDYDTDGDGTVDHVIVFHAGKDKSNGGGVQSWQAIWAHRGSANYTVDTGGTPDDRDDDVRIAGYTMQYEDAEPGVVIHEFGHDLGLPDLYDTSRGGANSSEYWDVMGAGGRCGKLNSTHPVMLSTWTKFALGWVDPVVITPTAEAIDVRVGQSSNPPPGSLSAVRVNLPPTPFRQIALPELSRQAWWTGSDQDWADVTLSRDLSLVGVSGPISVSFALNLVTERNWDFLFVEVSADGGQTYTQTKGYRVDDGRELTTPDNYPDANCILAPHPERPECAGRPNYGGLTHGYTGNTGGWVRVYHDLSPFAGEGIVLRLRYATDAGSLGRGAYVDNIVVRTAARVLLDDPVEDDEANDWTPSTGTFVPGTALGDGWRMHNGIIPVPKYYLVEWRNLDGFDRGLRYGYSSVFSTLTPDGRSERHVDTVPMNVPGMVVWLRDLRYGSEPNGTNNNAITDSRLRAFPSEGAKGGILVVDSHPEPLRGPRGGKIEPVDPETGKVYGPFPFPPLDNWSGRVQTANAAFTLGGTPRLVLTAAKFEAEPARTVMTPTRYGSLPAAPAFHDALGYCPGVEELPAPVKVMSTTEVLRLKKYALTDPDASVVVPATAYYPPRTPAGFTGLGAETSPPSRDVSTDETVFNFDVEARSLSIGVAGETEVAGAHSGHPGSDGLQFGFHFGVLDQAPDGSWATVRLWNSRYEGEARGEIVVTPSSGMDVQVSATVRNVGSPGHPILYADFDETKLAFVRGVPPARMVPVTADLATVKRALAEGGPAAVAALSVPADRATAAVWWSDVPMDTGAIAEVDYLLDRRTSAPIADPIHLGAAVPGLPGYTIELPWCARNGR